MPQGKFTPWSYEHVEILKDWITKYPKGKSINISQIKFSDPEKFQTILDAGHPPSAIKDKVYAMNHRKKMKAGEAVRQLKRYESTSQRATPLGDGRYKCNECGEIVPMKQALPGHYKKHGGRGTGPLPKVKLAIPTLPHAAPAVNSWHYCPNCAYPLDH